MLVNQPTVFRRRNTIMIHDYSNDMTVTTTTTPSNTLSSLLPFSCNKGIVTTVSSCSKNIVTSNSSGSCTVLPSRWMLQLSTCYQQYIILICIIVLFNVIATIRIYSYSYNVFRLLEVSNNNNNNNNNTEGSFTGSATTNHVRMNSKKTAILTSTLTLWYHERTGIISKENDDDVKVSYGDVVVVPSKCVEQNITNMIITNLYNPIPTLVSSSISLLPSLNITTSTDISDGSSSRNERQQRPQRGEYTKYHHISQILEGPAMKKMMKKRRANDDRHDDENMAICKFRNIQYSNHFPHSMQQLYRCWSWWVANDDKTPILLIDQKLKPGFAQGFLSILQENNYIQIVNNTQNSYNNNNNTIIIYDNIPYVQAKDTGLFVNNIEITDFAIIDPNRTLRTVFANLLPDIEPDRSCTDNGINNNKYQQRLPKVAILNRHIKSHRHIYNAQEIADSIEQTLVGQKVSIVTFENTTTAEQIKFFMETDIVISPHGAQLTGIAFMKNCSTVIELFPKQYLVPDYFGSLAASIHVDHRYYYFTDPDDPKIQPYERYHHLPTYKYRNLQQCPQLDIIIPSLVDTIANWRPCCARKTSGEEDQLSKRLNLQHNSQSHDAPLVENDILQVNSATIDIITIGEQSRIDQMKTQKQTFGSHQNVRNFFQITEWNDTDKVCTLSMTFPDDHTNNRVCSGRGDQKNNNNAMLCAQKRPQNGLQLVLDQYKDGTPIPDYLLLINDDTYLNIDTLIDTFYESYAPDDNHLIAGCTYAVKKLNNDDVKFVVPVGGMGSMMTRATIKKLMTPIYCPNIDTNSTNDIVGDNEMTDPFVRWACWRLNLDTIDEKRFFQNGMSIGDLMRVYVSELPNKNIVPLNKNGGFCFVNSDHALAYFLNFYHVSVPDWILNESSYSDDVRSLYSYRKLDGNFEFRDTGKGGECNNVGKSCNAESRLCRGVNSDQMVNIHRQQQQQRI